MGRYVIGVSGASGVILGYRTVEALVELGHDVELILSQAGVYTALLEMGNAYATPKKFASRFSPDQVRLHAIQDVGCPVASGSFPTDGMAIVPCSMATIAALSIGLGDNAMRRAADVALKEKRRLVLVPRETPLSEIHLENLHKLARVGAMIVPPMPAWYPAPKTVEEMEKFLVGKVLDALGVSHQLYPRWLGAASEIREKRLAH